MSRRGWDNVPESKIKLKKYCTRIKDEILKNVPESKIK